MTWARGRAARVNAAGLLLAAMASADPSPPPVDPVPQPASSAVVDRPVRDPAITEASGLALSPTHSGVIWTLNDSGNAPVLYAVDRRGATAGTVRLSGVPNQDWEAVAAWRDSAGHALLAVADIGDNGARRDEIEIDLLREPARLGQLRTPPLRRIRLRYPDGAADAETLLVDPRSQRMFVVTKGLLRARILAVPAAVYPGTASGVATLVPVGAIGLQLATDGTVLPSGSVLVRSYGALMLLAPLLDPGSATPTVRPLGTANLPIQNQGEGVTASATVVYLGSEGAAAPILRMPLPAAFVAVLGATSVAGASSTSAGGTPATDGAIPGSGSTGGSGGGGGDAPSSGAGGARIVVLGLLGGLGLLGLVGGVLGARIARRRGSGAG